MLLHAFHTVRIVLYIGCSGPVVESLNKLNMLQSITQSLGQNYRYTELCVHSIKSMNNFQNAPAPDFDLFFAF